MANVILPFLQWRKLGGAVSLHFLALPNAKAAMERVAQRVPEACCKLRPSQDELAARLANWKQEK